MTIQDWAQNMITVRLHGITSRLHLPDLSVQARRGLLGTAPLLVATLASNDRFPPAAPCRALGFAWTMKTSGFPSDSLLASWSIGMAEAALPPSASVDVAPLPPTPPKPACRGEAGKSLKLHPKCCINNHQFTEVSFYNFKTLQSHKCQCTYGSRWMDTASSTP
jgi:hypothetical protein